MLSSTYNSNKYAQSNLPGLCCKQVVEACFRIPVVPQPEIGTNTSKSIWFTNYKIRAHQQYNKILF